MICSRDRGSKNNANYDEYIILTFFDVADRIYYIDYWEHRFEFLPRTTIGQSQLLWTMPIYTASLEEISYLEPRHKYVHNK